MLKLLLLERNSATKQDRKWNIRKGNFWKIFQLEKKKRFLLIRKNKLENKGDISLPILGRQKMLISIANNYFRRSTNG